ncbi:MAG: SGNH/GDSL hydrolase family protein [Ignavibacteriae bacterium]|nr:SGNH/GDSL hydrolase family protein [Ignavibacteriota bacterium]
MIKFYTKIFLINLLIVILLFGLFEISIRFAFPQIQLPGTEKSLLEENVYFTSPGLVANSHGYSNGIIKFVDQNRFWKLNSPNKNVKNKILFLGDSITMGIGVESDSTFAGLLNSSLTESQILNSALIGYSSLDYKNIIKKFFLDEGNQNKISSVVLFWCLNDIYSNFTLNNEIEINSSNWLNRVLIFIRNNFKFYHFLKHIFFDRAESYYLYDENFYNNENLQFQTAVKNLKDIKQILDSKKINFYVITLPYEYQIRNKNVVNFNPQTLLVDSLRSFNINAIDISKNILKSKFNSKDLYLYGDGIHFSKVGHNLLSKIIPNSIPL